METQIDTHKTEVTFRKVKRTGVIVAILPHELQDRKGHNTCYEHVGQHGGCDYNYMLSVTVPVTEKEYSDLKKEMENLFGYNFKVVTRRNYDKYVKEYRRVNNLS